MAAFRPERFSELANRLRLGPMKRLYKYYNENTINMAGGLPMESCFPFTQMNVQLDNDQQYTLKRNENLVMNYHRGSGIPAFKSWVDSHVKEIHAPKVPVDTCVTIGNTDAFAKILMLIESDSVFFDQYAYGAAVLQCESFGKKAIGVVSDEHGILPEQLRRSIVEARKQGLKANLIYLVPVGQNPMGFTMSVERKKQLYEICKELDMIIVEDGK